MSVCLYDFMLCARFQGRGRVGVRTSCTSASAEVSQRSSEMLSCQHSPRVVLYLCRRGEPSDWENGQGSVGY
jgi:hypothetical protein